MATIKELASYTGLSPSTVSIVLRGKSQERSIPEKTQDKVWEAVKILGYQPNITARRLREPSSAFPLVIAIFWASDFRAHMMVRFLKGIQEELMKSKQEYEIVIHPYDNDSLCEIGSLRNVNMYNAAIICNASQADMDYLENNAFPIPIVLYNRKSERYSYVTVDDHEMGSIPAKIFAARNHKITGVITSKSSFSGMSKRIESFIKTATKENLYVSHVATVPNGMSGGYLGALEIMEKSPLPDCIFCASDAIAVGALRAFHKAGIKIPEDMELISIGNGDRDMEEYAVTSLSVVHLPMEEMAARCLQMIHDLIIRKENPQTSLLLALEYIARESCGDGPIIEHDLKQPCPNT